LQDLSIKKIGILGGSFDPPHKGHLFISKFAIKKLKLSKLLWIVTKKNPIKKKPYLKIKDRIKLSKKITKKEKKIFVQFLENKIKSSSTFDLLKYLKKKYLKHELYFLIGADNLVNFNTWKNFNEITKFAKIVIFPRKNYSHKLSGLPWLKNIDKTKWININAKKVNISSSLIRKFW
jgi:nicotinate-nucleotide adenylyltransferase